MDLSIWLNPVVLVTMTLIGGIFILIGAALFGFDKGEFVPKLRQSDMARGLITYLFAVTTIGIAIVLVLAVLLGTPGIDVAFDRGKEVLGLLLGIFGTIVGFYFGSELASNKGDIYRMTPLRLSHKVQSAGGTVQLTAFVSGGTAPYDYVVLLGERVLLEDMLEITDGWIDTAVSLPPDAQPGRQRIKLEVKDSNGKSQSSAAVINIDASPTDGQKSAR